MVAQTCLFQVAYVIFTSALSQVFAVTCERTDQRAFIRTVNARATDALSELIRGKTKEECQSTCLNSNECTSFVFWSLLNECEIRTGSTAEGTGLAAQANVDHYQKTCIKAAQGVCLNGFTRHHQKALIGFADAELKPVGLDQCLAACLDSATCLSVQYFYDTEECVLNTENTARRGDMFVDLSEDRSDYFEPQCDGRWTPWSDWTECMGDYQIRRRDCPIDGACAGSATEVQNCILTTPKPAPPLPVPEPHYRKPEPEPSYGNQYQPRPPRPAYNQPKPPPPPPPPVEVRPATPPPYHYATPAPPSFGGYGNQFQPAQLSQSHYVMRQPSQRDDPPSAGSWKLPRPETWHPIYSQQQPSHYQPQQVETETRSVEESQDSNPCVNFQQEGHATYGDCLRST